VSEPPARPHVYDKVDVTVQDFSFISEFPFSLSASPPGGGSLALDGKAGPTDQTDAASTSFGAKIKVRQLDLAASGFVEVSTGVSGLADFEGTVNSNGKQLYSNGTATFSKLKLSPKGSPAGREVRVKYAIEHDLEKQGGTLTQGDVQPGESPGPPDGHLSDARRISEPHHEAERPGECRWMISWPCFALGVVLRSGSSLKGGTLSTTLEINGPTDKLVITGPVKLSDTKLAGFNLASKMSAVSALTGTKSKPDTSLQNLSSDARVAPEGITTNNLNLTVPALGVITGNGTVSPGGVLNYKMNASLP